MASAEGGVDIEEVAARTPGEDPPGVYVDPGIGLAPFQAQQLAFAVGLTGDQVKKATKMMLALYQAFVAHRRVAARDQPAHRHRRAATCWRSTRR